MSKTLTRKNVKFVTNDKGFIELMSSSKMQSILLEEANRKANALTDGEKTYRTDIVKQKSRCKAIVAADSYEARLSNLKNNDLVRAIQ